MKLFSNTRPFTTRSLITRSSGVSLIETMVIVTVIGIAMAIGMPSYRAWIQNAQIRTAAESIISGLQRARAEAVSRNTNVTFTLGAGSAWTFSGVDPNGVPFAETSPADQGSGNVTVVANAATLTYGPLGNVTAGALTQVNLSSALLSTAEARELRVTVGVSGSARMCDPDYSVPTGDPRHC